MVILTVTMKEMVMTMMMMIGQSSRSSLISSIPVDLLGMFVVVVVGVEFVV